MTDNLNSKCENNDVSLCQPCINDLVQIEVSKINKVIENNLSILNSFKNMKCSILAYINALSNEFIQKIDHTEEVLERSRFNVLIESLIAGIHQSLRQNSNGLAEPYFQLWIQSDSLYDIGAGWIDGTTTSGCYDVNGDASTLSYEDCVNDTNYTWYGESYDVQYSAGSLAKLYPSKISLLINCNKDKGIVGDEILYHYNPTIQLLYDRTDSSLYLKWSDATYNGSLRNKRCIFPLLNDTSIFKSQVFEIVPPSPEDNIIWDTEEAAYNFIRQDCLLDNKDIQTLITKIEIIIKRCELTHQNLMLKKNTSNN